jgi:hypothetical protein
MICSLVGVVIGETFFATNSEQSRPIGQCNDEEGQRALHRSLSSWDSVPLVAKFCRLQYNAETNQ